MIDVPVEVKDILQDGRRTKNYRIIVLATDADESFTIDNNYLVAESVNIDERLCSDDTIKFGLCEGSSLEFQYFDKPNIKGRRLQVFIDINYVEQGTGESKTCSIPMGFFTVDKISRQANTGIFKVTAYNKLKASYLDQKANEILTNTYRVDTTRTIFEYRYNLLGDYQIFRPSEAQFSLSMIRQASQEIALGTPSPQILETYGVDSPFSYYEIYKNLGITPETAQTGSLKLWLDSQMVRFFNSRIPSGYSIPDALHGSFYELEKSLFNHIAKLIGDSKLYTSSGQEITYEFIAQYKWPHNCCSSRTIGSSASGPCSTLQWLETDQGLPHSEITSIRAVYVSSTTSYVFTIPFALRIEFTSGNTVKEYSVNFDGTISFPREPEGETRDYYEYYTNEGLTETARSHVPQAIYPDGQPYIYNPYIDEYGEYPATVKVYNIDNPFDLIQCKVSEMPDFTLRDLTSALFESECQFGQLNRTSDFFDGIELNQQRLFPAENLYPDDDLYPGGAAMSSHRSMYSKLWADQGNVQKWKNLIITYKDSSENKDVVYTKTINTDGTQNYNMSDNWMLRNFSWSASDIQTLADSMANKMRNLTWFPFEMWCPGLPYLETGDEIEVTVGDETEPTYILQRQLKGIQYMQDTFINGTLDIF